MPGTTGDREDPHAPGIAGAGTAPCAGLGVKRCKRLDDSDSSPFRRPGEPAASLNIHLHCLVLDGVYRRSAEAEPVFVEAPTPTDEALQTVLHKIITRTMKLRIIGGAVAASTR